MDITIGGTTLEKVLKKLRLDIDAVKRVTDESTGVEFSPELTQNIVDKVGVSERNAVKRRTGLQRLN